MTANAEQITFWTEGPGRFWVSEADALDGLHREALIALLAAAAARAGESVLDIGCGAGASALELARAVGPEGRVEGLDLAAPLLEVARDRAEHAGVGNLCFTLGDAQTHGFAPESADLIASRFGVMFFEDTAAAFANLARALRPGGRMALAAWAGPEQNTWFRLPVEIAGKHLPVQTAAPDAPGPMAFRDAGRVVALLRAAGLAEARSETLPIELYHPGGTQALLRLSQYIGPLPRIFRDTGAGEDVQSAVMDDLGAALQRHATADGIRLPAMIHIFHARRT